ncbi:MAG: GNAT family N-acetyltransferase [Confluentibacter sp.]|nr:GNAT family N-acetyltransferase [Confluentibacter sp.]HMR15905.1 GNAT family N-acetyltransferase [Mariniflexile sp.]
MIFRLTHDCAPFFKLMPQDWQAGIVPFWDDYKASTNCYLLFDDNEIVAGGLVFSKCPPDMFYAEKEAAFYFNNQYLYVGFIYVIEERRQQNLGSIWLENLKKTHPKQAFWLTIEELKLDAFYVKNGFKAVESLQNSGATEVVYVYNPI